MKLKINKQIILDLTVTGLFTLLSMTVISFIIPSGLTSDFLLRGSKIVSLVFLALVSVFLISWYFDREFQFKKKISLPKYKDFLLLFLPISPIINYIILNTEYLNILGATYVLLVSLIFIVILSFIIPILLSYLASFEMLMISGLSISFTILNMSTITENPQNHLLNSQFITQGSYLIMTFVILYLVFKFNKISAYILVVVFFISGLTHKVYNNFFSNKFLVEQSDNRLDVFLKNSENNIKNKKNIYILIYESYANLETLNNYGFDNSEQIKFLKDKNFKIYDGIYSNGASSVSSTSRILELREQLSKHGRYYISGNAFSLNVLKANGYKTVGLFNSPYFFGQYPKSWDEYYPKEDISKIGSKIILKAIFEGQFRFDIFDDNYNYDEYLDLKQKYLTSKPKQPTLFYSHNLLPGHSQNSGKCLPNEKESYFERVKKANNEMKNDVINLRNNDPNAIVVFVSDHGPYLTKNCRELIGIKKNLINKYDIQDRYGVFLAINWSKDINNNFKNIELSQDIFPAIFGNITSNENLFDELKLKREFFDRFNTVTGGINIKNGVLVGGKNDGEPLFENRSYVFE